MKILYCRVSSLDQKTDRQRIGEMNFSMIVEDKCSGVIPFFERPGGMKIKNLIQKGVPIELYVYQIDRCGRDLRDLINVIHFFTEKGICIHFIAQSLKTLDEDGKENAIAKMIISILGVVAEMSRKQIKENQLAGIQIAKLKGVYMGRKMGSNEDVLKFLSKPKNKLALSYLKKGYKKTEAAKLSGVHINTVTKISKLGLKHVA